VNFHLKIYYDWLVRAYLPLSHKQLKTFLEEKTLDSEILYAPTPLFKEENSDCDEEELEYLLSAIAGENALDLCLTQNAPGIVLALELTPEQIGEAYADHITLTSPIVWGQVQCALLAYRGEEELAWFAQEEIEQHENEWK
jgi:hypothetical protein